MKREEKTYPPHHHLALRAGKSQRPPARPRAPSQTQAAVPEAALSTAAPPLPRSPHGGSAPSRPASVTPAARPWRQAPPVRGWVGARAARLGAAAGSANVGKAPPRARPGADSALQSRPGPGAAFRSVSLRAPGGVSGALARSLGLARNLAAAVGPSVFRSSPCGCGAGGDHGFSLRQAWSLARAAAAIWSRSSVSSFSRRGAAPGPACPAYGPATCLLLPPSFLWRCGGSGPLSL